MATNPIFSSERNWSGKWLDQNILAMIPNWQIKDSAKFTPFHPATSKQFNLNAFVINAVSEMAKPQKLAVVRVSKDTYAAQYTNSDGSTTVFELFENGTCKGAVLDAVTGRPKNLPALGNKTEPFNLTPIFACLIMKVADADSRGSDALTAAMLGGDIEMLYAFEDFSDAVYYGVTNGDIKLIIRGGNIDLLTQQSLSSGSLRGAVICGVPDKLMDGATATATAAKKVTVGALRKQYASFAASHVWTAEEEKLIPQFPDDYPVTKEVSIFLDRYVKTRGAVRPMNNFFWRGTTSYGKSTGVEIVAAVLHMPLLRVTCSSTMETQNFLSEFVPSSATDSVARELPTFEEITFDPEGAYEKITGVEKEGATGEDCLKAYTDAVMAKSGGKTSFFKLVESKFVTALKKGYMCEVQEISRIKDAGVLVGLNEYDRPGAVIPLVDGSYVRRHPNALVFYTDNVGYASCRPVDPSVIRRMALVVDSFELPKEDAIARVKYNTGFGDDQLLDQMYDLWEKIQKYCEDNDITEGSISVTELEMWAQSVMLDGYKNVKDNCILCVVNKATSVRRDQDDIISSVLAINNI